MVDRTIGFFFLVVFFIVQRITYGDEYISCWATCDLANCGSSVVKNDSFVKCTWKPNSTITFESDYNMTLILQGRNCNVKAECDEVQQLCETEFHERNCALMSRRNMRMHLRIHDSRGNRAEKSNFKICEIGKLNSPGIKVTQKRNKIKISSVAKSCIGNRIEYRLNYTYTKEDGKIQTRSQSWYRQESFTIDLVSAAEYNFTLESTKAFILGGDKVYSDPSVYQNFVTSPDTAFDNGHFAFECDEISPGRIVVTWQKSGKVDFFDLTLIDEENTLRNSTRVFKTSTTQRQFKVEFDNLNTTWQNYTVVLVASNKGGKSPPSRQNILRPHCKNIPEVPCTVSSIDSSYFDVTWKSASVKSLLVTVSSEGKELARETVTAESGLYRQTGVQKCFKYIVSISILRGQDEYVLCTKEVAPPDNDEPPLIKLIQIGVTTINFQGVDNIGGCNYSKTFWWRIDDEGWTIGRLGETITVDSLKPKTKYRVEVTMDNNEYSKKRNMNIETAESGNSSIAELYNHIVPEVMKGPSCSGNDCNAESTGTESSVPIAESFPPLIVLSICCGALILTVTVIGCVRHIRKNLSASAKPRMHPDLQKQFDEAFIRFHLEHAENTEHSPESPFGIHSIRDDARSNFLSE